MRDHSTATGHPAVNECQIQQQQAVLLAFANNLACPCRGQSLRLKSNTGGVQR